MTSVILHLNVSSRSICFCLIERLKSYMAVDVLPSQFIALILYVFIGTFRKVVIAFLEEIQLQPSFNYNKSRLCWTASFGTGSNCVCVCVCGGWTGQGKVSSLFDP